MKDRIKICSWVKRSSCRIKSPKKTKKYSGSRSRRISVRRRISIRSISSRRRSRKPRRHKINIKSRRIRRYVRHITSESPRRHSKRHSRRHLRSFSGSTSVSKVAPEKTRRHSRRHSRSFSGSRRQLRHSRRSRRHRRRHSRRSETTVEVYNKKGHRYIIPLLLFLFLLGAGYLMWNKNGDLIKDKSEAIVVKPPPPKPMNKPLSKSVDFLNESEQQEGASEEDGGLEDSVLEQEQEQERQEQGGEQAYDWEHITTNSKFKPLAQQKLISAPNLPTFSKSKSIKPSNSLNEVSDEEDCEMGSCCINEVNIKLEKKKKQ